jgi:hypothetical protein
MLFSDGQWITCDRILKRHSNSNESTEHDHSLSFVEHIEHEETRTCTNNPHCSTIIEHRRRYNDEFRSCTDRSLLL